METLFLFEFHRDATLVAYVANQAEISEMGLLDTEENTLNEFWVMAQDGVQFKNTLDHMQKIQDLIVELAKVFENTK